MTERASGVEWQLVRAWDGSGWFIQLDPDHDGLPEDVQADDRAVLAALLSNVPEREKSEVEPWNSPK